MRNLGRTKVIGAMYVTSALKNISGESAWNVQEVPFAIIDVQIVARTDMESARVKFPGTHHEALVYRFCQ